MREGRRWVVGSRRGWGRERLGWVALARGRRTVACAAPGLGARPGAVDAGGTPSPALLPIGAGPHVR